MKNESGTIFEGYTRQDLIDEIGDCNAQITAVTKEANNIISSTIHAIVDTIGGMVEGQPTSELNYLERLRDLVGIEKRYRFLREDRNTLIKRMEKLYAAGYKEGFHNGRSVEKDTAKTYPYCKECEDIHGKQDFIGPCICDKKWVCDMCGYITTKPPYDLDHTRADDTLCGVFIPYIEHDSLKEPTLDGIPKSVEQSETEHPPKEPPAGKRWMCTYCGGHPDDGDVGGIEGCLFHNTMKDLGNGKPEPYQCGPVVVDK